MPLREPLRRAAAHRGPDHQRGEVEHQVRNDRPGDAAKALENDVRQHVAPRQFAARCKHEADRRVEMRARDRSEDGDEHDKDRARRDGIAEQRDSLITARQFVGHDARADHGGDEYGRAEGFRKQASR
jgi:hypothetical protein